MKRFATLAAVGLGALASVTAAQAGNTTITNTTLPFFQKYNVSCAYGGQGELVDVSGTFHILQRFTVNGNRVSDTIRQNFQHVTAVGETTGDTYVANDTERSSNSISLTNGQYSGTYTAHLNLIGHGSAPNFTATVISHVTINANGTVTVNFETERFNCG